MKLQRLKLFMTKTKKKNEFLEDFREISLVGSLNSYTVPNSKYSDFLPQNSLLGPKWACQLYMLESFIIKKDGKFKEHFWLTVYDTFTKY